MKVFGVELVVDRLDAANTIELLESRSAANVFRALCNAIVSVDGERDQVKIDAFARRLMTSRDPSALTAIDSILANEPSTGLVSEYLGGPALEASSAPLIADAAAPETTESAGDQVSAPARKRKRGGAP